MKDQARTFAEALEAFATEVTKERSYLRRAIDLPFLSQTVLTYFLQAHCHSNSIDKSVDSIKKSFNILALLAPPSDLNDDYNKYMTSSRVNEVE